MTLKLSHLDKLYWPKEKISKGDLIAYYTAIAPYILPYLKNRPLAMHRYPDGITGESFYQKDAKQVPDFVKTATVAHKEKKINYITVHNLKSLLYVVNLGSIELHLFHSTVKHIDKPDYLVIDLDPEAISFDAVIEVALEIHHLLEPLGIAHFCKTSGKSGLHIFVPLGAKYSYDQARQFALLIARIVHERLPAITSLERNPAKRQRKVYLDTQQNNKGQLVVAPYSVRAAPHATVSTPLSWEEVKRGLSPEDFTMENVPARLARKKDLFKPILGRGACLKKLLP